MSCHHSNANKLILGAILGGIVAGTSAAFLKSKTGKALRDQSAEKLQNVKDKLEEFLDSVSDKTSAFADEISDRKEEYSDKIHDFALQISEQIKEFGSDENKEKLNAFLIGGIVGGILGAGVAAMGSSEHKQGGDIFKNVGCAATSLKQTVQQILNVLDEHEHPEKPHDRPKQHNSVDDVLDFVSTGIKLWQRVKNK